MKYIFIKLKNKYGGYGIKVITPVCGTGNPGSIPGSHPKKNVSKIF